MKALSLKQPWAELILQGKKTIETRKWNTNFRGSFYIHASKNIDKDMIAELKSFNITRGALIGKANLTEVKEYKSEKDFHKDDKKHLAKNLKFRKYGFILSDITRIKPIPYKGQLNFFNVKQK